MMGRLKRLANRELDSWQPDYAKAMADGSSSFAIDEIWPEIQRTLFSLLETMPDPGWTAPTMRAFSLSGALYIAVHLVLRPRGFNAETSWAVCERATRYHFEGMGGMARQMASKGMFSSTMQWLVRMLERQSRTRPVGGWVAQFVPGAGEHFDYGVDYKRCAIHQLALAHGAEDFAPYICLADIVGSDAFGWGLVRTETLAQGGSRCDFRFHRGGQTRVTKRLPVL